MRPAATILLLAALLGCADPVTETETAPAHIPPPLDPSAGAPKLGPGDLFNACERIWCLTHGANHPLAHFLDGKHVGWILHDDPHGDVFAPRGRTVGPAFPTARSATLRLCGRHVHPWFLERGGGPIRKTGWNAGLEYDRKHFSAFGTRLAPCCENGLGWGFVHASSPKQFRLHDVTLFREAPGAGWQSLHRAAGAAPSPP